MFKKVYCMKEMSKRNKSQHLVFLLHNIFHHCQSVWKFEDSNSRWEICDEFLWERKKSGQIKGMISKRQLILCYTIRQTRCLYKVYPHIYFICQGCNNILFDVWALIACHLDRCFFFFVLSFFVAKDILWVLIWVTTKRPHHVLLLKTTHQNLKF